MMIPSTPVTEMAVLGGLLSFQSQQYRLPELTEDLFYEESNRTLYNALRSVYDTQGIVDIVSVESSLLRAKKLDTVGGINYILESTKMIAHEGMMQTHIEELSDYAIRRKIIHESQVLIKIAHDSNHEQTITELASMSDRFSGQSVHAHSLLGRDFLERERSKPKATRIEVSCQRLSEFLYADSGLYRGQIKYTLADSGHGKSRFAMYDACKVMDTGNMVHWFQLEDYGAKTLEHFQHIKDDYLDSIVMTDEVFSIEDIRREARKAKREYNTDYIVVDYVQNVEAKLKSEKHNKVEYISRQLALLAIELNVVVHATSQVTLPYESRKGWSREPRAGDARWSQQIKQDSHVMTSIFRPYLIEELVDGDMAKDWQAKPLHRDSVFAKQIKVRGGVLSHNRVHFIDTNKGFIPIADYTDIVSSYNHGNITELPF
jgi:replicative DNA helicase